MCMFLCWMCCGCGCFWNIHDFNDRDFAIKQFFLVIWGILNYVWFSWISSDFGVFNALIYLAELFHYKYILNTIAVAMIVDSFKALFGSVYNIRSLKGNSNIFMVKNSLFVLLNLIHTPVPEGYFNTIYCLFPVLCQFLHSYKLYRAPDNLFVVTCNWAVSEFIKYLGFEVIYNYLYSLIITFGIYFIEYPIVIFSSVIVGKQIGKVLLNIENYAKGVKTSGKTRKQIITLVMKEIFQYALLAFSLIFVHYLGEIIEWYHGYMPALISFTINLVYSYPAVILLKFPTSEGDYGLRYGNRDILNFVGVLFSNYLFRCLF